MIRVRIDRAGAGGLQTGVTKSAAMRTRLFVLPSLVVLALLASFVARPVDAGIIPIDRKQEADLGREVTAKFEQQVRLITSGEQYERVTRIGAKVAANTGVPELPWTFKVVDDPSVNAITFPGGYIYVFKGLLDQGIDDDALAGVLGHECAHAVKSHAIKKIVPIVLVGKVLPGPIKRTMATKILAELTINGVGRRFELESDQLGAGYCYQAGWKPEGLLAVFELFIQLRQNHPSLIQKLLATHPEPEVRIKKLKPVIKKLRSGG